MVGSPSYMAPEQIRGLRVGPPADLYALAVVTYEILAARRLFTVNDYETLLKEEARRDAPRLVFSARGELIPEPFADIIHNALAHDPTDRYPDAHTMLLALDQMKLNATQIPLNLFCELPQFIAHSESEANEEEEEADIEEATLPPQRSVSNQISSESLPHVDEVSEFNDPADSLIGSLVLTDPNHEAKPPVPVFAMLFPPIVVMFVVWSLAKLIL